MTPASKTFICFLLALLLALSVYSSPSCAAKIYHFNTLEDLAAQEDAEAQLWLGKYYHFGLGGRQDYQKAREWWEKAAAQRNAEAQLRLGGLYYFGQGVRQNYQKAREWYEKAAAQRNTGAQLRLGGLYEFGHGVRQNFSTAKEYYGKACDNGLQEGCDEYRRLNNMKR